MQKNIPLLPTIIDSEMTPLVILLLKFIEEQGKYFEEEVGKLKDQIARLEKNSSNSSKPPSSDITTRKEEQLMALIGLFVPHLFLLLPKFKRLALGISFSIRLMLSILILLGLFF